MGAEVVDDGLHDASRAKTPSSISTKYNLYPGNSDEESLLPNTNRNHIEWSKTNWRSISNLLLAIYSTSLSALWLFIAVLKPYYGIWIRPGGPIPPSTASTLCALVAKSVEIASVATFVNFLGQTLSRRSLGSKGITLADMSLRNSIVQPGFLLTRWKDTMYASTTFLGMFSILAAVSVLFFTSASDTLVSPRLSYGLAHPVVLLGNTDSLMGDPVSDHSNRCLSPLRDDVENANADQDACTDIIGRTMLFHDFHNYLNMWALALNSSQQIPSLLHDRPRVPSSVVPDMIIHGAWSESPWTNKSSSLKKHGRLINNVTNTMPHVMLHFAAQDKINQIPQPSGVSGFGEHVINATLPSPTTNVLCVNANATELAPLVYSEFPYADCEHLEELETKYDPISWLNNDGGFYNETPINSIFEWGKAYNTNAPVFPVWPLDNNVILSEGKLHSSANRAILMKSLGTEEYTICRIQSYLSTTCSATHVVTVGSHTLDAECLHGAHSAPTSKVYDRQTNDEEKTDDGKHTLDEIVLGTIQNLLFPNYKESPYSPWAVNPSPRNGNSSIARMISQFSPFDKSNSTQLLSTMSPSTAEVISVLIADMLIAYTLSTPLSKDDNLIHGQYQKFNATLRLQQYASGPMLDWHGMFYTVLAITCLANAFCLCYFMVRMNLVVDFTDSQDAFGVAFTSAPGFAHRRAGKDAVHPLQRIEKLVLRPGPNDCYRFQLATERKSDDEIELFQKRTDSACYINSPSAKHFASGFKKTS
ncbi:hypothetical protein GLAREA_09082 [Glarea lozoyensis ATCC 20868]|uniref:Uncharacterized protein n=1 Tax=Glarea lozoyensis (strain ATCC 20868 / MF5171) TaxID=1116229 RepID=S3DID6_GLAL2|nr:uncharacterized protein GLAREA_09082 [Glarea lozoyensis ATCC 20868]EPE36919.1 hypothetical protein GLAREA_09082 [Glarea lozoyensis ATCC 20868]